MPLKKYLLIPALLLAAALAVFSPAKAADALSDAQRQQVIDLIRETLTKNPDIVMEALDELRQRQERVAEAQKRKVLNASKDAIYSDPLTPVAGNPHGDISLVEFFDYRCGYCKKVFPAVMELLKTDKKLRYVIKEFPILGDVSVLASKAALAANKQGKYFQMHVALMSVPGSLSENKIMETAKSLGLDMDQLKKDMESGEVRQTIQANYALAQSLEITGTPAFIIGDKVIPGAIGLDQLEALIASARTKPTD